MKVLFLLVRLGLFVPPTATLESDSCCAAADPPVGSKSVRSPCGGAWSCSITLDELMDRGQGIAGSGVRDISQNYCEDFDLIFTVKSVD